ncbi:hypothetical protein [Flavisolibacter ginsenosidimutans]|uniref:Uncharacterized protein n=1 Tax=Flavisolibacter ginsenosidimutans TaxID=661481 RepID=A0A5B8UF36_9BACT|nr:hypothetical protein [Flavisolibacter ginsenosidimutans]QEC55267.1 hypothetical protein FSB75_04885 [Flavisolibacter ginsenosidimutans]
MFPILNSNLIESDLQRMFSKYEVSSVELVRGQIEQPVALPRIYQYARAPGPRADSYLFGQN